MRYMDRQERIARLALQAGWSSDAVSQWRKRGCVARSARFALARLAEARGERIEPDDFENWEPTRGPRARLVVA